MKVFLIDDAIHWARLGMASGWIAVRPRGVLSSFQLPGCLKRSIEVLKFHGDSHLHMSLIPEKGSWGTAQQYSSLFSQSRSRRLDFNNQITAEGRQGAWGIL